MSKGGKKFQIDQDLVDQAMMDLKLALGQLREDSQCWPAAEWALKSFATVHLHAPELTPELTPGDRLRLAGNIRRSKDLRDVWAGAAQIRTHRCDAENQWALQGVESVAMSLIAAQWVGMGLDDPEGDAPAPLDEGELAELRAYEGAIRDAVKKLPPRLRRMGRLNAAWADPEMRDALPW